MEIKEMNSITDEYLKGLIEKEPETQAPHERAEVVQSFVEKINEDRGDKYKPVSFSQINGQLRFYTVNYLKRFLEECENARCFGAYFWWKLKEDRKERKLST